MKTIIAILMVFIIGLIVGIIIALATQWKGVYYKKQYSLPPDEELYEYRKKVEANKYINDKKGTGNNSENQFNKTAY